MMKLLFWVFCSIVVVFLGLAVLFVEVKNSQIRSELDRPITIVRENDMPWRIVIREDVKPFIKKVIKKVVGRLYYEATIHNPQGDIIPDTIDDTMKDILLDKI